MKKKNYSFESGGDDAWAPSAPWKTFRTMLGNSAVSRAATWLTKYSYVIKKKQ